MDWWFFFFNCNYQFENITKSFDTKSWTTMMHIFINVYINWLQNASVGSIKKESNLKLVLWCFTQWCHTTYNHRLTLYASQKKKLITCSCCYCWKVFHICRNLKYKVCLTEICSHSFIWHLISLNSSKKRPSYQVGQKVRTLKSYISFGIDS